MYNFLAGLRLSFSVSLLLLVFFCTTGFTAEPITLDQKVHDKALSVLRAGLASEEFWPSMHAAEALTLAGYPDEVITALTPKLETITDDQQRCGIARELVRAGQRHRRQIILNILASDDPHGHIHACESLYKIGEVGNGNLLRKSLATEGKVIQQLMAAAALGKCGHPEAMTFIRSQLSNHDPKIARISAWILARLGTAADVPALKKAMTVSSDPQIRCYYQCALAMLGDATGKQDVLNSLTHSDSFVRTYAAVFAGEAGLTEAQQSLTKLLDDTTLDVRIRAAQALFILSKPIVDHSEVITTDVFVATEKNPRHSEGSIIQLNDGRLLFANTEFMESNSDYAKAHIVAMESNDQGRTWTNRRILQKNTGGKNVMSATLRRLTAEKDEPAPIGFFYLIKNDYNDLKVYLRISTDEGKTFGEQQLVTDADRYHVMNNDRMTRLASGRLLIPVASTEDSKKENHFVCHCYFSDDAGKTWQAGAGKVDAPKRGAMEPEVIELRDGRVMMIIRNQLGFIGVSYSEDQGETWSDHENWNVIGPEAPATLRRVPSTGDLLLIWNNNVEEGKGHGGKRTPLTAAISKDDGKTWQHIQNLETSKEYTYAYTSLIFTQDRVVMSYYVFEEGSPNISTRFRSFPISSLYK